MEERGGYLGGIVGENRGAINKSYNYNKIHARTAGGICGSNYDGVINKSYNYGIIEGFQGTIGGIVGYNGQYDGSKVIECLNEGNIIGNGTVGGIIGYNTNVSSVTDSINKGKLTILGKNENIIQDPIVGNKNQKNIINCKNESNILIQPNEQDSTNETYYAGGIIGYNNEYGEPG